jgi:hypothetical protein
LILELRLISVKKFLSSIIVPIKRMSLGPRLGSLGSMGSSGKD